MRITALPVNGRIMRAARQYADSAGDSAPVIRIPCELAGQQEKTPPGRWAGCPLRTAKAVKILKAGSLGATVHVIQSYVTLATIDGNRAGNLHLE